MVLCGVPWLWPWLEATGAEEDVSKGRGLCPGVLGVSGRRRCLEPLPLILLCQGLLNLALWQTTQLETCNAQD